MIASSNNLPSIVKVLVENGAKLKLRDNNEDTALTLAIKAKSNLAVDELIRLGSNVKARDKRGWTALMLAAQKDIPDIAKTLIDAGADVNAIATYPDISTALTFVAINDGAATIKILAENGANLEIKNKAGISPLVSAILRGSISAVEEFIKCGANVNTQDNDGDTALIHTVANADTEEGIAIFRMLIKAGADPNIRSKAGYRALDVAVEFAKVNKNFSNSGIVEILQLITRH